MHAAMTDRQKAIAAILSAIPALILACAGWLQADAAKRSEARLYQEAGMELGEQSDARLALEARLARLERGCPTGPIFQGNRVTVPGGTGIHVGDTYQERNR